MRFILMSYCLNVKYMHGISSCPRSALWRSHETRMVSRSASTAHAHLHASGCWQEVPTAALQLSGASLSTTSDAITSAFDYKGYHSALATKTLGRYLLTSVELQSTQSLLQDNRSVLPSGTLCVADRQAGGKGRSGNIWTSPPGCLMFSLLFETKLAGQRIPFVQYVACIAVVAAAQRLFSNRLGITANPSTFPVRIKWPNDIYVITKASADNCTQQKPALMKIGGILCQSCYVRQQFSVIVGVGINVDNSQPTTCINNVLQDAAAGLGKEVAPVALSELLAEFVNSFEPLLQTLERDGFDSLKGTYQRYWLHQDQCVMLQDPSNPALRVPIKIVGITDAGYLKGIDEAGNLCELHPDGNSLDMMQGLIKRKLPMQ